LKEDVKLNAVLNEKPEYAVWIMRQAGRYLPEYRALREKAGSFWKICFDPKLAAEATLQPIKRFGFDAAIIFSDILTIPDALGFPVIFEKTGPQLEALDLSKPIVFDQKALDRLLPVYEAINLVRTKLDAKTALLGFAGAPWTLACYMAAGKNDEGKAAKFWAYRNAEGFSRLIDTLVEGIAEHLIAQLKAGADAVQLFDSMAGGMAEPLFVQYVVRPTKKIVARVHATVPGAKVIGFPRGATLRGYGMYAEQTGIDVMSLDTAVPITWATANLSCLLQGNLDPLALVAGGEALEVGMTRILDAVHGRPHIFNLGHGILPETPIENVEKFVSLVRSGG